MIFIPIINLFIRLRKFRIIQNYTPLFMENYNFIKTTVPHFLLELHVHYIISVYAVYFMSSLIFRL